MNGICQTCYVLGSIVEANGAEAKWYIALDLHRIMHLMESGK